MSDLIVIGYPDHDTAQRAYQPVVELQTSLTHEQERELAEELGAAS